MIEIACIMLIVVVVVMGFILARMIREDNIEEEREIYKRLLEMQKIDRGQR